jgi:hypothetical protein
MGPLVPLTVVCGEYLLDDLQTNVVFNSQHLQIALLSDVECMDDFCFRKEDLTALFDLLLKPLDTVLKYVPGLTDLMKVKHQYTVLYETGCLMILYWLSRPNRV